jgi:uncharacterized protein YllA (UPF0747 family)
MILENGDLNIQNEIEKLVSKKRYTYMDAVLKLCEDHSLEPSYIAKHLTKPIIEKLREEGESINLLPKSARLPF